MRYDYLAGENEGDSQFPKEPFSVIWAQVMLVKKDV
jgi:hypothetical protein